jgi:hypothetical protein
LAAPKKNNLAHEIVVSSRQGTPSRGPRGPEAGLEGLSLLPHHRVALLKSDSEPLSEARKELIKHYRNRGSAVPSVT